MPDAHRRLTLPPPYAQHWLAEGDVAAAAVTRADEGAGTLIWTHRPGAAPGRLDFAVVLEPDEPLDAARRAHVAGLMALAEALAAHCPPDHPVQLTARGEVRMDGSRLGGLRLLEPAAAADGGDGVPDWLILSVELIADRDHLEAAGSHPASVSLQEQGFDDPALIVESFAAHLMLAFDRWRHEGFGWVARAASGRLDAGRFDDQGAWSNGPTRLTLPAILRDTPWRDAGGPIL